MKMTEKNAKKSVAFHKGKIWLKRPSMNLRQSSGVQFRGVYLTLNEYKTRIANGFLQDVVIGNGTDDEDD